MLSRGFTTVRDTGGASAEIANATEEWLIPGPRIVHCGKALSQTVNLFLINRRWKIDEGVN